MGGFSRRLTSALGLLLAAGAIAAQSAQAGTPFVRGDVFGTTGGGVSEYSPSGQLRQTIPMASSPGVLCFDPSGRHLIVPGAGLFDSSGNLLASSWASVPRADHCAADGSGHVYLSRSGFPSSPYTVSQYDIRGTLQRTFTITDPQAIGLAIDVAPDNCTVYYGSWGGDQNQIGGLNACDGSRAPDLIDDNFVDDLRVLPDWRVLVTDDSSARLYDASGHFVRTYRPSIASPDFRTMSLDPDGRSFWMCCALAESGSSVDVYRFDIESGQELASWTPAPGFGAVAAYGPPLVGDADVERTVDANSPGTAEAFTARAGHSGGMSRLHLYVDSTSTARSAIVGVYSDRDGHPGTLQGQATISDPRAGAWNFADLSSVPVTAGKRYWLAVLTPRGGGTIRLRDTAGGGRSETSAQHGLTSLPRQWSSGTAWASAPLSAYGS